MRKRFVYNHFKNLTHHSPLLSRQVRHCHHHHRHQLHHLLSFYLQHSVKLHRTTSDTKIKNVKTFKNSLCFYLSLLGLLM